MALAADNTLSATQLDEKYKKQGYIQFKNAAYHNGELITIIWAQGHMLELKEPEDYKADWKEWRFGHLTYYSLINLNIRLCHRKNGSLRRLRISLTNLG